MVESSNLRCFDTRGVVKSGGCGGLAGLECFWVVLRKLEWRQWSGSIKRTTHCENCLQGAGGVNSDIVNKKDMPQPWE